MGGRKLKVLQGWARKLCRAGPRPGPPRPRPWRSSCWRRRRRMPPISGRRRRPRRAPGWQRAARPSRASRWRTGCDRTSSKSRVPARAGPEIRIRPAGGPSGPPFFRPGQDKIDQAAAPETRADHPRGRQEKGRWCAEPNKANVDRNRRWKSLRARVQELEDRLAKHLEAARIWRASERRYQDLVENLQDLVWQLDPAGRILYINPIWEQLSGYPMEETLGRRFTEFQSAEASARDMRTLGELLDGPRRGTQGLRDGLPAEGWQPAALPGERQRGAGRRGKDHGSVRNVDRHHRTPAPGEGRSRTHRRIIRFQEALLELAKQEMESLPGSLPPSPGPPPGPSRWTASACGGSAPTDPSWSANSSMTRCPAARRARTGSSSPVPRLF